jgi:hypothetical protein
VDDDELAQWIALAPRGQRCYVIEGGAIRQARNLQEWADWLLENEEWDVAETELPGGIIVATIFHGIDNSPTQTGAPLVFNTRVYRGPRILDDRPAATRPEAETNHWAMVARYSIPSITCPKCKRTSFNPGDIRYRYCGACHEYHDDMGKPFADLGKPPEGSGDSNGG